MAAHHSGILNPTGAPQEVYGTVERLWMGHAASSDALRTYAIDQGRSSRRAPVRRR